LNLTRRFNTNIYTVIGNFGLALVSFITSLALLKYTNSHDFGAFSIFMIVNVLIVGISNAVFISPMMILLNDKKLNGDVRFLVAPSVVYCIVAALLQSAIFYSMMGSIEFGLLVFFLSLIQNVRWFVRGYVQNKLNTLLAAVSDIVLLVIYLSFLIFLLFIQVFDLKMVIFLLIISNFFSCIFLFQSKDTDGMWIGFFQMKKFSESFQTVGKSALVGAVTAEVSSNFHNYMILVSFGPSSVAIIAAANLLFRPVSLVHLSTQQTERAAIRRLILDNDSSGLSGKFKTMNVFLYSSLLVNVFVAFLIIWLQPSLIWSDIDRMQDWILACILSGVVVVLRTIRTKDGIVLQSNGSFKKLADATVFSAFFVVATAPIFTHYLGAVYSLWSIVIAETIMVCIIRKDALSILAKINGSANI
jgi:hypothetical protein